jgi:peptidylamidoglycolate lyase
MNCRPILAVAVTSLVFARVSVAQELDRRSVHDALQRATSPPYQVVHGWPVLPDNGMLEECSAVAVDSHDHVFVLTRGGRKWPDTDVLDTTAIPAPTVLVLDGPSGRPHATWPAGLFALPHSITIDRDDRVWITDVAWHQVFEFTHDGKLLLALGERGVPGADGTHFNRPTDVAVARDGSFYVSDGYGNDRILHFGRDGKLLRQWGTKGSARGELDLPHALALDAFGNVFVVDRANARIAVFTAAGAYSRELRDASFAGIQDVKIGRDDHMYVASAGTEGLIDHTGVMILNANGQLIEKVGRFGNYDGQFVDLHWVAVAPSGALYAADFAGRRVQKFVRARRD